MIFLETQRLQLRNVCPEDASVMFDYRNNEICARYQRGQTQELSGIEALVAKREGDTLTDEGNSLVAVALKETGEMIGEIVVMPNDGCFTLGYTFSYRYHRKGFAFEALSALTQLLHERYPEMEFISFTDPENIPSRRLLEKLGYTDLGYMEKITSNVYGKWLKEDSQI